jgi:hypothetical protein
METIGAITGLYIIGIALAIALEDKPKAQHKMKRTWKPQTLKEIFFSEMTPPSF